MKSKSKSYKLVYNLGKSRASNQRAQAVIYEGPSAWEMKLKFLDNVFDAEAIVQMAIVSADMTAFRNLLADQAMQARAFEIQEEAGWPKDYYALPSVGYGGDWFYSVKVTDA